MSGAAISNRMAITTIQQKVTNEFGMMPPDQSMAIARDIDVQMRMQDIDPDQELIIPVLAFDFPGTVDHNYVDGEHLIWKSISGDYDRWGLTSHYLSAADEDTFIHRLDNDSDFSHIADSSKTILYEDLVKKALSNNLPQQPEQYQDDYYDDGGGWEEPDPNEKMNDVKTT